MKLQLKRNRRTSVRPQTALVYASACYNEEGVFVIESRDKFGFYRRDKFDQSVPVMDLFGRFATLGKNRT